MAGHSLDSSCHNKTAMYPRHLRRWLTRVAAVVLLSFFIVFVFLVHNQTYRKPGRSTIDWYTPSLAEQFKGPTYNKMLREIREVKAGEWMIVYSRTRPQAMGFPQPLSELAEPDPEGGMAIGGGTVSTPGRLKKIKRVRKRRVPPKKFDTIPKDFSSQLSYLTFPLSQFTSSNVLQSDWVDILQSYLRGLKSKQVSVVTANVENSLSVINWLISAHIVAHRPLENVLVLSLSKKLYGYFRRKEIPVMFVDPHSVLNNQTSMNLSTTSQEHIVHLTFIRLVNHWGFNVAWYNANAVVLNNPQPLFDRYPHAQLIGSEGHEPRTLYSSWGRTLSTQGVLLMRSSYEMEIYWETMANISKYPFTEDGLVNLALDSLEVEWYQQAPYDDDLQGRCSKSDVKAVVLSEAVVCHYTCDNEKKDQYYIWHNQGRHETLWFVREDWSNKNERTGLDWLKGISENTGR